MSTISAARGMHRADVLISDNAARALNAPPLVGVLDRRRQPRRSEVDEHGIHRARVHPGIDVRLLDVSTEGAAIETAHRLLPGRRLTLHLSFATCALAIRSSVVRSVVSHASADRIVYRGALAFEQRLQWIIDAAGAAGVLLE